MSSVPAAGARVGPPRKPMHGPRCNGVLHVKKQCRRFPVKPGLAAAESEASVSAVQRRAEPTRHASRRARPCACNYVIATPPSTPAATPSAPKKHTGINATRHQSKGYSAGWAGARQPRAPAQRAHSTRNRITKLQLTREQPSRWINHQHEQLVANVRGGVWL
jgi:hypothetical protein